MRKEKKKTDRRKGALRVITALLFISLATGCDDRFESPAGRPTDDRQVEVHLTVGFADPADGAVASPVSASATAASAVVSVPASSSSGAVGGRPAASGQVSSTRQVSDNSKTPNLSSTSEAFDARLLSAVTTKTAADTPAQLYNLEVCQYDASGNLKQYKNLGTVAAGSALTLNLTALTHCQLVFLARGATSAAPSLSGKSLSTVQNSLTAAASVIDGLTVLDNMPYILHLPDVNLSADGKIQSPEGRDVRIRLQRLAVRLYLSWTLSTDMQAAGYHLKEVRLCQVPKDYRVLPASETTEWGSVYPVSSAEFTDKFRLTENLVDGNGSGGQTLWIPANARGQSGKATSALYRSKENAPTGATYLELVVDNTLLEERLYYRAYLGGMESTDFNLYENTDYHWAIRIQNAHYTTDPRIQLLDQTPVVSQNLVSTANCFMIKPGTNICFNPYRHASGTNGWNDFLVSTPEGTPAIATRIDQVKVHWQTKDAGTVGDLIMGYVIDENHHENLVNLTDGDNLDAARVSLKLPGTKGGNAVIAAYSGETVVWSWHIWATDYEPQPIRSYAEYATAQLATRHGTVHKYDSPLFHEGGVYEKMVMMDRDLGARIGGYPALTTGKGVDFTTMDAVDTYGLLYQWGRKDPFFNSLDGTNNEKDVIYDGYGLPVNVDKVPMNRNVGDKMAYSVAHPLSFYYESGQTDWYTSADGRWNAPGADNKAPGRKGLHDPCPYGWKVPMMCDQETSSLDAAFVQDHTIFTEFARTDKYGIIVNNTSSTGYQFTKFLYFYKGELKTNVGNNADSRLGRIFLIGNTAGDGLTIYNSVWIPATAERRGHGAAGDFGYAGQYGHLWCADVIGSLSAFMGYRGYDVEIDKYGRRVGWPLRCIQDGQP